MPHDSGHASFPETLSELFLEHLEAVSFATQAQPLSGWPFLYQTSESSQVSSAQVSQETMQASKALVPSSPFLLHREFGFKATHSQPFSGEPDLTHEVESEAISQAVGQESQDKMHSSEAKTLSEDFLLHLEVSLATHSHPLLSDPFFSQDVESTHGRYVGTEVGKFPVGLLVGYGVGRGVGLNVKVGKEVGFGLGKAVGRRVGLGLGKEDGLGLGSTVGVAVGWGTIIPTSSS